MTLRDSLSRSSRLRPTSNLCGRRDLATVIAMASGDRTGRKWKALTRRVAFRMDNHEYRPADLMPVAELIDRLSKEISRFLDAPVRWESPAKDKDEAAAAIALIRSEVLDALHSFAMERVVEQHLVEWERAFNYTGRGSSYERARDLREIYGEAAPVPGIELSEVASEFLARVRKLVIGAIRAGGGDLALQDM